MRISQPDLTANNLSPAMSFAFAVWRAAWLAQCDYDVSDAYTDEQGEVISDAADDALLAIFRVPCKTAGDFLVKGYANLLWHTQHTFTREARSEGTGNWFDVNLLQIDSDSTVTDTYYRSFYHDLDHTDLGACLLALGRVEFDAAAWISRAEVIGMTVTLMIKANGGRGLAFGMIDSDDERLQREQSRLQRILATDHRNRWAEVTDFIAVNRPDLICQQGQSAQAVPA